MRKSVLILSHLFDPGTDDVITHLRDLGVDCHRFNCAEFPLLQSFSVRIGAGEVDAFIELKGRVINASSVGAVWFRRAAMPALPIGMSAIERDFARNEVTASFVSLFDSISAPWINDRVAERAYSNKFSQLGLAVKCGFSILETLITNSPAQARLFSDQGETIFKPVAGATNRGRDFTRHAEDRFSQFGKVEVHQDSSEEPIAIFTKLLDAEKRGSLESLVYCPATFQRFVDKSADLRITVVGSEVFACEIDSQGDPATRVDFRRMALLPDGKKPAHREVDLPSELRTSISLFMKKANLEFGCFDILATNDGGYYFLEVNPNGQWTWIERATGMPISRCIARRLSALMR